MDSNLQLKLANKTSASMDWSMLPTELLSLIISKIDTAADWASFRSVCKTFRSLLPSPYRSIWFVLPQSRDNPNRPLPPSFAVVLGEQKIHQLSLPEAQEQRCVGSTGTWIITADLHNNIRLFNPFTREFELNLLPQFTTYIPLYQELGLDFQSLQCDHYVRKIVLSSSDFTSGIVNTNCVAAAIRDSFNNLAFARPGDEYWSEVTQGGGTFEDVIFFNDTFFLVTSVGDVLYYKHGDDMGVYRIMSEPFSTHFEPFGDTVNDSLQRRPPPTGKKYYLVAWMGELLRVRRYVHFPDINQPEVYQTVKFEVHRRNSTDMRWVVLSSLGEYSLFFGGNTSVAVKASNYSGSVKRNCIYFTSDYTGVTIRGRYQRGCAGGHDMGVYDMEDKTIHSIYSSNISSPCSNSIWVIPPTLPTQGR